MRKFGITFIFLVILCIIVAMFLVRHKRLNNIVLVDNNYYFSFELLYKDENNEKISKILKDDEIDNVDYNVYSYGGTVKIKIDNEELNLRDALLNKEVSISSIISKCIKDAKENKVESEIYKDGGTVIYKYENYWIIKFNTIDGNKDLCISRPNVSYNDIRPKGE